MRFASTRAIARSTRVAAVFGLLAMGSCERSTAPPTPAPSATTRTVTAVLVNGSGSPVAYRFLVWTSATVAPGYVVMQPGSTNEQGEDRQALLPGAWTVETFGNGPSAGASFTVWGLEHPPADTQLVRLVVSSGARVLGVATLEGASDHRGTIVTGPGSALAETDSTGAWSLDHVPVGHWTIEFSQLGYQAKSVEIEVVTPGVDVTAPSVALPHL